MVDPTEKRECFLIVSYWPLLDISSPQIFDQDVLNRFESFLKNQTDIYIDGCLWLRDDDGSPMPVLIMPKAQAIYEHLMLWCENDPTNWFFVVVKPLSDDRYVVMVHPELQKSINRFRLLCLHQRGKIPAQDADYKLVYHPLRFISQPSTTFQRIAPLIGSSLKVGFIDSDRVSLEHPEQTPLNDIPFIGPLTNRTDMDVHEE